MIIKRYQWVGLLAGLPLFSGAWLSAYYNNSWWGSLGFMLTAVMLWAAIRSEKRTVMKDHVLYGLVAGLLAGLVARLCGLVATGWAYDEWSAIQPSKAYEFFPDLFRNILNGNWMATIGLAALVGVVGVAVAVLEPDQKKAPAKSRVFPKKSAPSRRKK